MARTTDAANYLIRAIRTSDPEAVARLREAGLTGRDAWSIHLDLFPAVQEVMNPPFINPHLPKMYAVCRDLRPYLEEEDIPALLYMEAMEYARRDKLSLFPQKALPHDRVGFDDVERAIQEKNTENAAHLLAAFLKAHGAPELARRLLLLGSGYLEQSLGHSISCTSFILLEMMEQLDRDPWPALVLLSDYFCKGGFDRTMPSVPAVDTGEASLYEHLLRATTGSSFLDIHHTITFYAIERARPFLTADEYQGLLNAWLAWMGSKEKRAVAPSRRDSSPADYETFYQVYSTMNTSPILEALESLAATTHGYKRVGTFLIRGLCDRYRGDYNPHYVTGLAAALWVGGAHGDHPSLALSALHQYLGFLSRGLGKAA